MFPVPSSSLFIIVDIQSGFRGYPPMKSVPEAKFVLGDAINAFEVVVSTTNKMLKVAKASPVESLRHSDYTLFINLSLKDLRYSRDCV